jgi:hypothetical protein
MLNLIKKYPVSEEIYSSLIESFPVSEEIY